MKSRIVFLTISRLTLLCFVVILNTASLRAQDQYNLKFKIEGLKDTTVYLGYYYGESTYLQDTTRINDRGEFAFTKSTKLTEGMYFLVLNNTKIFDIAIGKDQDFTIETSTSDYIRAMKISGDIDNELFHKSLLFNGERYMKAQPLLAVLNDSTASTNEKNNAQKSFDLLNKEVRNYQKKVIEENPDAIVSKLFIGQNRVEVPNTPNGESDSRFKLNYYKKHFWDNFNLSDEVMIRLPEPFYFRKMEEYLDNLFVQSSDSLTPIIDYLVEKSSHNQETYKYMVWNLTLKYQNPKFMGLDQIFIHIYDKYFETGEMDYWANETLKKNLKERADQLRKSLIGNIAPNMIMLDSKLAPKSMHDIKNKYTVLYFYDPDCSHCKEETPRLNEFYKKTKFDVEVFAVCSDTSMVKMNNYIEENNLTWISVNGPRTYTGAYQESYDANTTPTIFLLDENKRIITKKLEAAKLEDFIRNYEKSQN
ncbi:thioredoxin-like domain-containing protein [Fulvivirgaceae bacterium BMA10]|uniref:Thioredoxin-like domain-containing protein n=1 Tax=Splendidivirga corallicola TaxID=3051826 RepID=A0ABT8KIB5_9BACT|nr:thioredoxin-like domain-containing protein [Fulvivirgaceae bacterium BMA10]